MRLMSCPKSTGRIVADEADVEASPPGPLDPGGEGGKEGTGTLLILELATDWAVEILLGGCDGPLMGVCEVLAVRYVLSVNTHSSRK